MTLDDISGLVGPITRNNVLLFEFDLELDAEKVLQGEPWSFDRHLVIL